MEAAILATDTKLAQREQIRKDKVCMSKSAKFFNFATLTCIVYDVVCVGDPSGCSLLFGVD